MKRNLTKKQNSNQMKEITDGYLLVMQLLIIMSMVFVTVWIAYEAVAFFIRSVNNWIERKHLKNKQ